MMMGYGMGGMWFATIFNIITLLIICMFIYVFYKIISTNVKNSNSPRLTVSAKVLDKRMRVRGDHSRTTYFITFEVESGDRLELQVYDKDYGLIIEGDQGNLTFQETKFLDFQRELQK